MLEAGYSSRRTGIIPVGVRTHDMISRIFGGLPVMRMPMRKILADAQSVSAMAPMSISVVPMYSSMVGGPAARFIITNGVKVGMNDITFAKVPLGSRPMGTIASSGSISVIMTGIMSACASWMVFTTEPMPIRIAAYSR